MRKLEQSRPIGWTMSWYLILICLASVASHANAQSIQLCTSNQYVPAPPPRAGL